MKADERAQVRSGRKFQHLLSRLPLAVDRPWIGYGVALLLSALAALAREWANPLLPPGFPFLTFFPAVIVTAFLFGNGAGTFAAVLSGLAAWYFFIPPVNSFDLSFNSAVAMLFYVGVVAVDIGLVHLMQQANRRLVAERTRGLELVAHRELLFSELQHRVGNNLQMSASLLQLQKRKLTEPEARAAIDEAARRLGMIGRVQRQLYDPTGAQLDLATFLQQLAQDVLASSGRDGIGCTVVADGGLKLSPDAAIPTALIVAEAISNAVEHGFAAAETGTIAVTVRQQNERLLITVEDDGAGLPENFGDRAETNLGLRICKTLAQGLHGQFALEPGDQGIRARLDMPYA